MVTPKGSMSTEGERLQVSVLPYRCLICLGQVRKMRQTLDWGIWNSRARAVCWLLRAPDKRFSCTLNSLDLWPLRACSFRSAQAAAVLEFHVPLTNCFVRRWLYVVHGPKPPLHRYNWLSFSKFQDTECFLIPCPRHVSLRLPPSSETCKYATAPSTQKNLERFSTYWYAPFCSVCLGCWRSQVQKFQMDLWITLYIRDSIYTKHVQLVRFPVSWHLVEHLLQH